MNEIIKVVILMLQYRVFNFRDPISARNNTALQGALLGFGISWQEEYDNLRQLVTKNNTVKFTGSYEQLLECNVWIQRFQVRLMESSYEESCFGCNDRLCVELVSVVSRSWDSEAGLKFLWIRNPNWTTI